MNSKILWVAVLLAGGFVAGTSCGRGKLMSFLPTRDTVSYSSPSTVNGAGLSADETNNIEVYNKANEATVAIVSTILQRDFFFDIVPVREAGSGFFIDDNGTILTNHHVISGTAKIAVTLAGGKKVRCRPVFDLVREYAAHFDPKTTEDLTWAPAAAVESLARHFAKQPGTTLFAVGMGPNQFFNNDNKDRATLLLAALTGNIGRIGGNVGSYAGNYRIAIFNGAPQYINENPFDLESDPARPARVKQYWRAESAHYYNHEDHPLRVGNRLLTGQTHMPCPTKTMWFANANSILGNVKWHFNTVMNVLPRMEMIAVNEWWWTASCEWADVVFAVDSWSELKHPDMTASCTNPFLIVFPRTPLPRIFETRGDIEVLSIVGHAMAKTTGDDRFAKHADGRIEKP